jgi:hypothetical protein
MLHDHAKLGIRIEEEAVAEDPVVGSSHVNADLDVGALAASAHGTPHGVEHCGWRGKSSDNLLSVALKACRCSEIESREEQDIPRSRKAFEVGIVVEIEQLSFFQQQRGEERQLEIQPIS